MAGEKIDDARRERLERFAREVVRASAAGETEGQAAADSPFLYARVRARIEAERGQREEGWLALFGVAWRAVPAMALVAVMAFALFLSSGAGDLSPGFGLGAETLLTDRDGDFEQVVFADARTPSNDDDVLSTIIGEGEGTR